MSNGENAYANESVNFTTICAQTLVQNLFNYYGMFNSNCILIFFLPGSIRWWSILNPISQAACHPQYRWHWCWRVWSVKWQIKVKICRAQKTFKQKFTSCLLRNLLFWCAKIQGQCCNCSKSEVVWEYVLALLAILNLRGLPIGSKGQLRFWGLRWGHEFWEPDFAIKKLGVNRWHPDLWLL